MADSRKTFQIKEDPVGEVRIADEVVAIIAGLAAEGTTEIKDIHFIERGYECIVEKLRGIGADIKRVIVDDYNESGEKKA